MKDNVSKGINVLYLDVSTNFYENDEERAKIIEQVETFINRDVIVTN